MKERRARRAQKKNPEAGWTPGTEQRKKEAQATPQSAGIAVAASAAHRAKSSRRRNRSQRQCVNRTRREEGEKNLIRMARGRSAAPIEIGVQHAGTRRLPPRPGHGAGGMVGPRRGTTAEKGAVAEDAERMERAKSAPRRHRTARPKTERETRKWEADSTPVPDSAQPPAKQRRLRTACMPVPFAI